LSELITHIAVLEDCTRLALVSNKVCTPFKLALERHSEISRLGCLSRGGDKYPVHLLEYCRERWESRRAGDFTEEKLAFMLGWRCYNAADRHFKPIYRQVQPEYYKTETGADPDETNTSHARMFHDLIVYREVYDCGKRKGLSQRLLEDSLATHQAAQSVAVPAVEAAMGSMIQRSLLGMQAFASGEKTPEGWLRQFGRRHQQYYVDIHRFARGAEEPPPNWLRRFILDNNFYDRRDPLLPLARALHEGKTNPGIALDAAVEQAQRQSQYAQALRKAYRLFRIFRTQDRRGGTQASPRPRRAALRTRREEVNRRQFAYVTALLGAAGSRTRRADAAHSPAAVPEAAGLIIEMVFLDDCVRVAMYDPALPEPAKTALAENGDFFRNGALSPAGSGGKDAAAFALAAGRVSSEILRRHRRPRSLEARLYQDMAVLRDLAVAGGRNPDRQAPIGDLLDLMHVRRQLSLHTLIPDDGDFKTLLAWLEGVCTWNKEQHDLRAAIAAAYCSPDHAKMRELVSSFYAAADPLIQLAREFQYGRLAPADALASALEKARQGSGYARALNESVEALRKLWLPQ